MEKIKKKKFNQWPLRERVVSNEENLPLKKTMIENVRVFIKYKSNLSF